MLICLLLFYNHLQQVILSIVVTLVVLKLCCICNIMMRFILKYDTLSAHTVANTIGPCFSLMLQVQPTSYENSAFLVFMSLLARMLMCHKLNLYIPLSQVSTGYLTLGRKKWKKLPLKRSNIINNFTIFIFSCYFMSLFVFFCKQHYGI